MSHLPSRRGFLAALGATSLLAALAAPLALSGCGKQAGSAQAAPAKVRLGYFPNLTHAQAVLGVSSGDFGKALAPSALETRVFTAGPSAIEALLAGEVDVVYVGPSPAFNAHLKTRGQGIRVVGAAAKDGILIVTRPEADIASAADLKGKRIATPQKGNTQDQAANFFVRSKLGAKDAATVIPVPPADQAALFAKGDLDASWAVEPWASILVKNTGAKVLGTESEVLGASTGNITLIATTPEFLRDHPQQVAQILKVNEDWSKALAADGAKHEDALRQALEKLTGKALSAEVLHAALGRVRFTSEVDPVTFRTIAEWTAAENGLKPADVSGLVVAPPAAAK